MVLAVLKSRINSGEAGMADCKVRSVSDAASNGWQSNSSTHEMMSCTACSSTRIRAGAHISAHSCRSAFGVLLPFRVLIHLVMKNSANSADVVCISGVSH